MKPSVIKSHYKQPIVFFFLLIALDQLVKYAAVILGIGIKNSGGVIGLLPGKGWDFILPVIWFIVFWTWLQEKRRFYSLGLLLILAGGFSNILDRFIYKGVIDMIHYPIINIYGNMADIFIIVGCALLFRASFLYTQPKI